MQKKPRQPKQPQKKQMPVDVKSYFRKGKRVVAHKRHSQGDANHEN